MRELKAHASAVLHEVQTQGAEFIVTIHGRPVARIEPVEVESAATPVDGMGNSRGLLSGFPSLDWDDFERAKKLWEPRALDDE